MLFEDAPNAITIENTIFIDGIVAIGFKFIEDSQKMLYWIAKVIPC